MTLFSKINSRLWITYVLLVAFVLFVAFAGMLIAFRNNPLLYWSEFVRLNYVSNSLSSRLDFYSSAKWDGIIDVFLTDTGLLDVRVLIFDVDGMLYLDSMSEAYSPIPMVADPAAVFGRTEGNIRLFQDNNRKYWFYQINPINQSYYLLAAIPRPKMQVQTILRDELLRPLFRAGIIALFVAFIVSWFVARWITRPLENISESARKLASGDFPPIEMEGPLEVQQLAEVINTMDRQVRDTIQSQKNFVANVSHELKTPLTSIQGFAQAIHDDTIQSKDETKRAVHVILEETDRLNYLVNDLLMLAKLDAGTIQLALREFPLNPILKNILEKFSYQITDKDLEVEIHLENSNIILGDGERIIQVFNNLIDNAIKFSRPGGKISISDRQDDHYAVIEVADEGIGISADESKKVFERFYQADKSRGKKSTRSVGLGLSIAHQIIKMHAGEITVQSTPGKGSRFMVKIPLAHAKSK